jgi:DNA (cytosine-5)-methyltransferase 3A
MQKKGLKILSLFDGMSVAQQALKNAGIKVDAYYASEIDPYAIATTQSNFPDTIQLGDVKDLANELEKINREWTKDIDLMIGGSPCQDLSIAKKGREGLNGSRSGLFWDYVRILKEVKPKYFILENVNSMPKEAKELITETLWGIEPVMINAALVSAQNRKRLFWVGKLDEFGTYKKVEILQPEDKGILLKDILEENVDEKYILNDSTIKELHRTSYGAKEVQTKANTIRIGSFNSGGQADRVYSTNGKSTTLSANGGGRGAKTGLYQIGYIDGKNYQGKRVYSTEGKSVTLQAGTSAGGEYGQRTGLYYISKTGVKSEIVGNKLLNSENKTHQQDLLQNTEGKCRTIPAGTHGSTPHLLKTIMSDNTIRKLTPIECLRLQSMPDDYFDKAIYKGKPISNSQRYKMVGNAFNCKVVEHIIRSLK